MSNYIKPTDTELEFLKLMGIEFNDSKFIKSYKERPHSRTDIVYIHLFRCNDTEILFYRKDDKPTLQSIVVKKNGEVFIAGEELIEGKFPKRFVTYKGEEPKYYNTKIYVVTKPMINGKYFFETRLYIEFGRAKAPSIAIKFEPTDALKREYSDDYEEFINNNLDSMEEARAFFLKIFPFFQTSYRNALRIPIEHKDNILEALSFEEDVANAEYDKYETELFKEKNDKLKGIRDSKQALYDFIIKYGDKDEKRKGK